MDSRPASVLLVDGHSLIHRAFHALPPLSVGGVFTNAVQGFVAMLFKAIADYRPDALCVMLDMHAPTFRHTMYDEYKAGRKPTPEELRPQFPIVREILTAMGVTICEMEGYEADDLLGTAAKLANAEGIHAFVLTGDRDSFQLVSRHTQVILTKTGISESLLLTPELMREVYGYGPEQVTDMKGLMGDSSDNIPGVPGVGEKTALKLITQYGTLENVLAHADEVPGKLGEKLRLNCEQAEMSKDLGTIRVSAPLKIDFDACGLQSMLQGIPTMQKYQLNRLSQQLNTLLAGGRAAPPRPQAAPKAVPSVPPATSAPQAAPAAAPAMPAKSVQPEALTDAGAVRALAEALAKAGKPVAVYLGVSAVGIAVEEERSWYIPVLLDILSAGLYEDEILTALNPLWTGVPLLLHGAKALYHRLAAQRLPIPDVRMDTMVAAYLLEPTRKGFSLAETLAGGGAPPEGEPDAEAEPTEAPKKGKKTLPPPEPPRRAAELAAAISPLATRQRAQLEAQGMLALLTDMEQPLTRVLFAMEREGFSVDKAALAELGTLFGAEIERCRAEVIRLTGGEEFNVNSPRQLGEVLFEKLGLAATGRRGKAGAYSTSADVLEAIDHPAIQPLLTYRKLTKLVGTYIEGLTKLVDASGRIHTTFDQTGTVTGRISSVDPNLQNIPVRSEEGREIRKAFVAREGCVLLDADYSQIELRVLAHLSGDPAMRDAFIRGQDIHTRTAAEVNGVPFEQVTPAMRRSAKAVNFGIVYGISGFGLANNIGVSRKEADAFIATYFERYPMVKAFMDASVHKGYEYGYAETLYHRRRELYELKSGNRNIRSFGERAAMNTPVQGTAADIIKLAMVRVQRELLAGGYAARLILQVHDELVVECPEQEVQAVSGLLQAAMEGIVTLSVPLVAEVSSGKSWYDAK
jgi:DNA polymerase-1